MQIEISNGELVDKWTILIIKLDRLTDATALANVQREYNLLSEAVARIKHLRGEHVRQLTEVNLALWYVEDELRRMEANHQFDTTFIEAARSVYVLNDRRSRIKRQINEETKSLLVEEKCYDRI